MKQRLVLAAYRLGWAALRRAPERLGTAVFVLIADIGWWHRGKGVRRLEHNLSRVVGPLGDAALRSISRAGMRSYFRYWYELFRLPVLTGADLAARTTVVGFDTITAVRAEGRGVILALPHMGNWDQAGAWLVGHGVPFTTVAERLEPAELFDRFVAFRESLGMEVLALTGAERSPYAVLRERLRDGGVICLLADRDLTTAGSRSTSSARRRACRPVRRRSPWPRVPRCCRSRSRSRVPAGGSSPSTTRYRLPPTPAAARRSER